MQPTSVNELLHSVGENLSPPYISLANHISRCAGPLRNNIFVPNNEDETFRADFVHGINIDYMSMMKQLQRKRPCVKVEGSPASSIMYSSDAPLPVHNTGTRDIHLGDKITVVPPLTNITKNPLMDYAPTLQTFEHASYERAFSHLIRSLRVVLDAVDLVDNETVTNKRNFLAFLYTYLNDTLELSGNTLWVEMNYAVRSSSAATSHWEVLKYILEVAQNYWLPALGTVGKPCCGGGGGEVDSTRAFVTPSQVLKDLFEGLKQTGASETPAVDKIRTVVGEAEITEETDAGGQLLQVLTAFQRIQRALLNISQLIQSYSPPHIGIVVSAPNSQTIPPSGIMYINSLRGD